MRSLVSIAVCGAILVPGLTAAPAVLPRLDYSVFLGSNGTPTLAGGSMAVDSSGNVYLAATVAESASSPVHVQVQKLDPNGNVLFTAKVGGSGNDTVQSLQIDQSGNIVIAGFTSSADFPIVSGNAAEHTAPGIADGSPYGFIARLDAGTGNITASTFLGGANIAFTQVTAVAIDSTGAIYATGITESTDFHTTAGTVNRSFPQGGYDCFVSRLSSDLTAWDWSTYLTSAGAVACNGIALDGSGNVYVTGQASADGLATPNGWQQHERGPGGVSNAFVAAVNPVATALLFFSYLGGSMPQPSGAGDIGTAIAVDPNGNVWVSGATLSSDFPTANPFQPAPGPGFVAEFNSTASSLVFSSYFGGEQSAINAMAVDAAGMVYLTGVLGEAASESATSGGVQPSYGGGSDAFLLRLSPGGAVDYFTYLGGSQYDQGYGIAVDPAGETYIAGLTQSPDFPMIKPAPAANAAGGIFVSKLSPFGPEIRNVQNSASFTTQVSPGSLTSVFGSGFAQSPAQAQNKPLPESLGGVTVKMNNVTVPLLYVDQKQVNFQVPFEAAAGPATVTVQSAVGASQSFSFTVLSAAPGIFVYGNNRAAALDLENKLNTPSNSTAPGDRLQVFMTGPGPLDGSIPDGAATPSTRKFNATLSNSATIGGLNAPVHFLGMAPGFVGLGQANVQVPTLSPGDYPLIITVNGVASNGPMVSVK